MSHEQAPHEALPRQERLILFILAAVQFTTIVDFIVVMPLGPQLMRHFDIGTAEFGLIVSSYTFAAGVAGLVAAAVVDRFARRTTFMVLNAGFLIGTLLCALAPTYPTLVLARIATGAFGGILGGTAMTIIGDVVPEHRRGRATGLMMTGFALASVAGVPMGMFLGTWLGWHAPFIAIVLTGLPALLLTPYALPRLDAHVRQVPAHPLQSLVQMFSLANHRRAFALMGALTIGGFVVFPYIPAYYVANVGLTEEQVPLLYVAGGALTLLASPIVGRWADRYGKLKIFRTICPLSAALMFLITHLPEVSVAVAVLVFGMLMVANVGRMIPAMAMVTGSVECNCRGAFLSANSSVQHVASGLGAFIGGLIVTRATPVAPLENFGIVGWIAVVSSISSLWLAGRLRVVDESAPSAETTSLVAAAEASADAGEPILGLVDEP